MREIVARCAGRALYDHAAAPLDDELRGELESAGVTLLADDPAALKEIVYEMRFYEVSARYAEFGPFVTGLLLEPAEALERVGMPDL